MTIAEFMRDYNLHDSLIEKIDYDKENKIVSIEIDFCYWQQDGYTDDMPETGMILVKFSDVSKCNFTPYQIDSDEIVDVSYDEINGLSLTVMNDVLNEYVEIIICANNVIIHRL